MSIFIFTFDNIDMKSSKRHVPFLLKYIGILSGKLENVNLAIGFSCYGKLTAVKTRYPLDSITWPYPGLECTVNRGTCFFFKLMLTSSWFFIGSRVQE